MTMSRGKYGLREVVVVVVVDASGDVGETGEEGEPSGLEKEEAEEEAVSPKSRMRDGGCSCANARRTANSPSSTMKESKIPS